MLAVTAKNVIHVAAMDSNLAPGNVERQASPRVDVFIF